MSISVFITDKLKSFLNRFPMAKVRYGFDNLANVHTIEVSPSTLLDKEDVYNWVDGFVSDAIELYPNDLVCVCPPDDVLGVGEIQYEEKGLDYNPISTFTPHSNGIGIQQGLFTKFSLSERFQWPKEPVVTSLIESLNDFSLAA